MCLTTVAIAAVAGWLSWRGWYTLSQTGVARSVDAGRFELAGPVVLGFVLARTVGIFGFHLTFSSGLAWAMLSVEASALVMLGLTGWVMMTVRGKELRP